MESKSVRDNYHRYLTNFLAKDASTATLFDKYMALAYAVRTEFMANWISTQRIYHERNSRRIYYLSIEYMLGKCLQQNIVSLGIEKELNETVKSLGFSLDQILAQEDDSMLGNGSEGRIAACFLEALASQGLPAMAYGIRYDYGQFNQEIRKGMQVERPNAWLYRGHPWEVLQPEYACTVKFGGECCQSDSKAPFGSYDWNKGEIVHAIPFDVPIIGYRNNTVNTLRLWSTRASEEFLPDYLNHGDYDRACEEKFKINRITQFLFPDEEVRRATDLRMKQQYFFISASIQDILRRYKLHNSSIWDLDKKVAIHLAGSRCALAIPELMRILVDIEKVSWERAWEITRNIFSYTSHAVFKEDSEIWPVYKVGQILPRHLQTIFDINQLHLDDVRKKNSNDFTALRDLSLIEEGEVKRIRFADMAVLGSSKVNGVSQEQADIIIKKVFPSLSSYLPERFTTIVNGIGLRRWLLTINAPLTNLITKTIGDKWHRAPERLIELEKSATDINFLNSFLQIKFNAKKRLAAIIESFIKQPVDASMMFDVQTGKIHPARRQVLNLFHLLYRYLQIKNGETLPANRLHLFSGKASPSDFLAKQIIHLISTTADLINNDPEVQGRMQVAFLPDFAMSAAERIAPAVDVSEQIATTTFEPSGTFNMKYAFNGAVTIASQSGTNNEMIQRIGKEYIFSFGLNAEAFNALRDYKPGELIGRDDRLKSILNLIESKLIPSVPDGHAIFPLVASLRDSDRHLVLSDFNDYIQKQAAIDTLYSDPLMWAKMCVMNIARIGWFSSDRAVKQYAAEIWKVTKE